MLADLSSFIGSVWACGLFGCLGFAAGWFLKGKYGHKL